MRKKQKSAAGFIICFAAGIIAGFLAGMGALSMLVSYRMDGYHQQIKELEAVKEDLETRLEKLEESINKRKYILKEINVVLLHDEHEEIDTPVFEKFIKEKYRQLLGKEVKSIDMDIIEQVIDERIFNVGNRMYKLKVSKVMLTEVLKIWIRVEGSGN